MAIKKAYVELMDYLEANKDSKVKTILPGAIALCSAKSGGSGSGGSNFIKNADGEVTHVFCYYHKKWEAVADVEFGKKTTSPTGLNNMCKIGTSAWTKQQRAAKTANNGLLDDVMAGKVEAKDLEGLRADIDKEKSKIVPREDGHGTDEKPA